MNHVQAYYNENDKKTAAWLRELIKGGHISDGEVDERDIRDVLPADLRGFDRCHFFAGIGIWDYALNNAGWESDRQVWTGSCPCQPFSAAGKGDGFDDERHLWPDWFHLINVCRPDTLFGEQVSSKNGTSWLELVYSDLEGIGYTAGALDIPAASVGAPHIRQRLFFVADSDGRNTGTKRELGSRQHRQQAKDGETNELEIAECVGRRGRSDGNTTGNGGQVQTSGRSGSSTVGDAAIDRLARQQTSRNGWSGLAHDGDVGNPNGERCQEQRDGLADEPEQPSVELPGLTNGFWRNAEWIYCTDGKYRPVEPSIFPLAYGNTAGRVGLLRGAGNAINAELATAFIESYMECEKV